MTKSQIIDKYIQRIVVDYPEADKIHIDLVQFAEEFSQCNISGSLLTQTKELFAKLTNDERIEVAGDYCKYCGQNEAEFGKCYCAPCYDE